MTSFRQIEAIRRNACKSTGPITEEGKQRSRCNAVRHGLTAETVIGALDSDRPLPLISDTPLEPAAIIGKRNEAGPIGRHSNGREATEFPIRGR
jgi:hypothetical protein